MPYKSGEDSPVLIGKKYKNLLKKLSALREHTMRAELELMVYKEAKKEKLL